jgi:PAS domain S-box-containing protein
MNEEQLRVLLVDDESSLREPLAKRLRDGYGYQVDTAADATTSWRLITGAGRPYHVVLVDDLLLPAADAEPSRGELAEPSRGELAEPEPVGVELVKRIKARFPETECIVFTGWGMDRALEALHAGAYRYLAKPLNLDELGITIQMAAEQARLRQERDLLSAALSISNAMVSAADVSRVLQEIAQAIPRLTGADACALALLDPLTNRVRYEPNILLGDESVAWKRHRRQGALTRQIVVSGEPFVVDDVGALVDELDENLIKSGVSSFIALPIPTETRNLGVLYAYSLQAEAFGHYERQVLTLLAQQAGIALENAELLDSTRRASEQLSALNQVVLEIGKELDRRALLGRILEQAMALLAAEGGGVHLLDPTGEYLTVEMAAGLPIEIEGQRIERDEGLVGEILRSAKSYTVADYGCWEKRLKILDAHKLKAVAGAPIQVGEHVWGALVVHDTRPERRFDDTALRLLQRLANHAGLALQKAALLEKLQAIQEVSTTVTSSAEFHEVFNRTCRAAVELFGVDHSGLVIFDQDLEWGTVRGEYPLQTGARGKCVPIRRVPVEARLALEGETLVFPDVAGARAELGPVADILLDLDIQSIAIVPIVCRERVLGSFSLDAVGHTRQFAPQEIELCRVLAAHVAVAVENARLFSELAEAKEWREALIENAFDAVIAIDERRRVTVFNRCAEEMFGWTAGEMLGRTVARLHQDVDAAREILASVRQRGTVWGREIQLKHRDGTRIPALLSATLIQDSEGRPIGQAGFMRDLRRVSLLEERLRALIQVSQAITETLELDNVLQLVVNSTVSAFPMSQSASIHLYDERDDVLRIRATSRSYSAEAMEATNLKVGEGIAGWVFQQRQPLIVADTRQDPRYKRIEHPEVEAHRSMICVPLWVRERVIGTLSLDNSDVAGAFKTEDLGLLLTFADQTTIAIENARLYEEAARRQQLLAALDEASRQIRAEKETAKLLHQTVRRAAGLVGCEAGGLFIHRPHLGELELTVTYGLPAELDGSRLPHSVGLAGLVAQTARSQVICDYSDWPEREAIFEPCEFKTAAAVPLRQAGEVEAVLLVADSANAQCLAPSDLEILERFAAQAAIAVQTSRLMSREQRMLGRLGLLHQISDYIQMAGDLDKILHAVLTGLTAGYGLGFNRAAFFLLDERREHLVGRMGIGHFEEPAARRDWEQHHRRGLENFQAYLELIERDELPLTPVGERIRDVRLPFAAASSDLFAQVVREQQCTLVTQDEWATLPECFVHIFEPALPLIVAPLLARGQAIGLLVADNKFTESPITPEDKEALLIFVNAAGIAIDNAQLFRETKAARERLRSFYEASNALVSSQDLERVLQDIVEQARLASGATWVKVVLIDDAGRAQGLMAAGIDKQFDMAEVIRPDGLSMQVMRTGKAEVVEDAREQRVRVNPSMFRDGIQAAVCLPLSLQGRRVGVMWLHYDEARHFPEFEIEALQLYVNQAAIAYDSARRMHELKHMRRAAEALAGAAGITEVLEQIVKSAREVLKADSSVIWSYESIRHTFLSDQLAADGVPPALVEKFRDDGPRSGGTAEVVLQHGYLAITDTTDSRYDFLGPVARGLRGAVGARAFQGAALRVGKETLGVLYVNYAHPRSFSSEDRVTLETFAHHAALTLNKARLLDQVSRARDTAKIVAEVSVLEDLRSTLNLIVRGTHDALNCDAVTLYTYDQGRDEFGFPPAMFGVRDAERVLELGLVARESVVKRILDLDQAYVAQDAPSDPVVGSVFVEREAIKSSVSIPLRVGDRKVGAMFVNFRSRHRFTDEELTNIELFAHQAAVAIRNAQLFDETIKRTNALQSLYEAGKAVASTLALDETLNHIAEQAWRFTGQYGHFARFSDLELVEGDRLKVKAAYPPEHLTKLQSTVGDIDLKRDGHIGITGQAVKNGQCRLVGDVTQESDYIEYDPETHSELAVPIKLGQDVIGVINVEHPEPYAFDEQDQRALEALAAQAALAIRNAQLYQERQQRISTLQALYRAGQAITSTMALQETLDQIVKHAALLIEGRRGEECFSHLALVEGNVLFFTAAYTREILVRLREKVGDIDLEHSPRVGITGRVAKTGRSQNVGDVSTDPDYISFESRIRSELAVPIRIGEHIIGVINIEHPERDAFSASDQQALESLAAWAAIAIRNARQNELQRAIYEASKVISSGVTVERQELLNRILEQAVTHVRWPQRPKALLGLIQLYDDTTNELHLECVYPLEEFPRLVTRLGERRRVDRKKAAGERIGIQGRVVLEGKVQRVPDVRVDQDYVELYPGTLSELDVPLRMGDRILGVLGLESDRLAAFDEIDEKALQSLAELAVIAIQNARLYREAARRLEESRALQKVATSLAGTLGLEQVLQTVMKAAMRLTDTDSGSILFWDAEQETFTRTLTTRADGSLRSYHSRARREGGVARTIISERKPIVIPDTQKDPRVSSVALEKERRALIGVPLLSREEAIGVLYVSSSEAHQFSNRQEVLLNSLANQATVAIERARHYEELKQAKGLVGARTALAWMGMASSAWRHTIDKHALTIREQLLLFCQDWERTSSFRLDTKLGERIATIERLATQILEKPITPPLSSEAGLEQVSLNALVSERARQLWQGDPYRRAELQLDIQLADSVIVWASPEWLRRALDILVDNALDAVADCEVRQITVGTRMADGVAEVFVTDTGPGIPAEIQDKIGLKRIEKPEDAMGLGMGLLMAQAIVQTYGGEIRVGSTGSTGTTMLIWLPWDGEGVLKPTP